MGGYPKVSEDPPKGHWTAERYAMMVAFGENQDVRPSQVANRFGLQVVSSDIDHPHDWGPGWSIPLAIETRASLEALEAPSFAALTNSRRRTGVAENLVPVQHVHQCSMHHEPHRHILS